MEKMFEYAVKNKLRFPYKGQISAEDLYDLTRTALDGVYKTLIAQRKTEENEESLMTSVTKTKEQEDLDAKIAIVKYVFGVKTQEALARQEEKDRKDKKQKLMAIKAEKEDEAIRNMSAEEIQKMIDEL